MIVYLAVNRVNQKAYVGQTAHEISARIASHIIKGRHLCASYFQRAINKYGIESFDFAVLERCNGKAELNETERRWIRHFGSIVPGGYNVGSGGEGSLAVLRSQAWKDSVTSPEVRQKHSDGMRRYRASLTAEQNRLLQDKINAARKGKPILKHRGDGNPAKRPENRVRISEGLRRSWQDPEVRKRRAFARKWGAQ